ncbi:efflux RND transporter periplasmic adaptor subunit [Pontibacter oryzae]|uniref:Efflux RND transporter periplasmic adaptor subunit n=1 Tax=Pontibacter oryzae TaxID=2304593 RepID=A0A399RTZ9_9BACT|nr:efflux RND transporter periplasmic adaptor subunit [Pontibacter oryzae]RIJ34331.1 efflux RND transporter periplasmic adaptor subunit [Pontibacter oryzae]
MKRYLNILFLLLLVAITACSEQGHEHAEGTTYTCPMHPQIVQNQPGTCPICGMDLVPVSQSGTEEGELMLSESQIALGNIKTERVKTGDVNSSTILTGKLVLDETQTDVISSRATGRIEKLFIKESGQGVRQGQPLYELYSEELLTLQREYLLALKQHQELGKENPRFASFLNAAKQKLLLFGLTQAQVKALSGNKNLDARVTFVAPAAGVVTDLAVAEGQYVSEGTVLFRLGKLNKIWVEAELYPQEIANVQAGDQVSISVEGFAESVSAKVTFISPEYRQGSQVAILRAELPNTDNQYLPGMQASVMLPGKNGSQLVLPTDAVIRDGRGSHVWVQTGKSTFKARMVNLGDESADRIAILSGIKENEKVVTSGAYLLYSEFVLKKGADPMAGHQH